MTYAIILAGGKGTRFWPLSRTIEPKQFLNLCSNRPMIEETMHRINGLIKKENIYITTNKMHNQKIKGCQKALNIPKENILFEPESKNTLAPISILASRINKSDSGAVIVVLPCDHFIKYTDKFLKSIRLGISIAKEGYIVTLGVLPHRPETGYGYIKIKSKIPTWPAGRKNKKSKIYKVDRFIEKPKISLVKRFIKDKRYYWNSGIFIFRPDTMLEEIKRFKPDIYRTIIRIKNKSDLKQLWHRLPCVSIDYGIMEKTKKAVLLPLECGWVDIGSWQSVDEVLEKDRDGNVFKGNCIDIGSKNSLIWSDHQLVATLGLNNVIVVSTKDALLVCAKDKAQDVKKLFV